MKILVTGACGWTATSIVGALAKAGHTLTGFDLPGADCPPETRARLERVIQGDVANFREVEQAVRGVESIVHLAVAIQPNDYKSPDIPFKTNVQGTYNIFEAARREGARKILLMGSAPVHIQPYPTVDCAASDGGDHLYDLTKCLQERIAENFCATFGMQAVTLRAGHIVDFRAGVDPGGRSLETLDYCRGGWVCRYDLADAVVKAIERDAAGYEVYNAVGSSPGREFFDTGRTEKVLGVVLKKQN